MDRKDFIRQLGRDAAEVEAIKMEKMKVNERANINGKKSKRQRRALKDRRCGYWVYSRYSVLCIADWRASRTVRPPTRWSPSRGPAAGAAAARPAPALTGRRKSGR